MFSLDQSHQQAACKGEPAAYGWVKREDNYSRLTTVTYACTLSLFNFFLTGSIPCVKNSSVASRPLVIITYVQTGGLLRGGMVTGEEIRSSTSLILRSLQQR
jgi:hypothetical protein